MSKIYLINSTLTKNICCIIYDLKNLFKGRTFSRKGLYSCHEKTQCFLVQTDSTDNPTWAGGE